MMSFGDNELHAVLYIIPIPRLASQPPVGTYDTREMAADGGMRLVG